MSAFDYTTMTLATRQVPSRERIAVTQEIFGREILNLELEQSPDTPLYVDFRLHALPMLKLVSGTATGVVSHRTRRLLADSNDDLFLSLNETDLFHISQRGREVTLEGGDAVLISCAEPASFRRAQGRAIGLRVPRAIFAHATPVIEDLVGLHIPAGNEALRLLRNYVTSLESSGSWPNSMLRPVAVSHIHDLLMLAVSAAGDAAEHAAGRGLKAARLREIKALVARRLPDGDIGVDVVATALGLTVRYVQRLFEDEGTTFTTFILNQRLANAHKMLRDVRHASRLVGAIAHECGFGDVSHFNRMFRRLYGVSPSDVRAFDIEPPPVEAE
ncbi:MAG TPA: AraC family transcriptional regulator [Devosiaceae bacterium]|jgi:AraC-like DNA-binding protein